MTELYFRWFGVAGFELCDGTTAIHFDPYFTRMGFLRQWIGRAVPDEGRIGRHIEKSRGIFISHSHYDHLLDTAPLALRTGCAVYGSANTCRLMDILGIPGGQIRRVRAGDTVRAGSFGITVHESVHSMLPGFGPGAVKQNLRPPLRAAHYRLDECYAFEIRWGPLTISTSVREAGGRTADILLCNVLHRYDFSGDATVRQLNPRLVIPLHWDDFYRPLTRPIRPTLYPPPVKMLRRFDMDRFRQQMVRCCPGARIFVPEPFASCRLDELARQRL